MDARKMIGRRTKRYYLRQLLMAATNYFSGHEMPSGVYARPVAGGRIVFYRRLSGGMIVSTVMRGVA